MFIIVKKSNLILIMFIIVAVMFFLFRLSSERNNLSIKANSYVKTILLDPGHGGEDPGAVSDYSGIKEKDINLDIAKKLKSLLEEDGYKVVLTREDDKLIYTEDAKRIVDKRKQDLLRRKQMMDNPDVGIVVSIHLNKFPDENCYGAQVFYPPDNPESKILAEDIQASLKEIADTDNQRTALVKNTKPPIIILRDVKNITVVVECGFLSNKNDEMKLNSDEYRIKIAQSLKQGIVRYLNR